MTLYHASAATSTQKPEIVVIGSGFFATAFAAALQARGHVTVAIDCPARADTPSVELPAGAAVLVVDLLLARRDDFALLRALRSDSAFLSTPTFVLSSGTVTNDVAQLEDQLRAFGVEPLLEPVDLDTLLARLTAPISNAA